MDDIFKQRKKRWNSLIRIRRNETVEEWECPKCKQRETVDKVRANKWVCRNCGYYLSMAPMERIQMVCDEGSFREMNGDFTSEDPLHFPDYGKKLTALHNATGQTDAFVSGVCRIAGIKVALGVLDSRFLMGSMGTVVGEKILRLTEYAGRKKLPLIIFSASGGARMQEGLFSLMQMAKTAAAVDRFKQNGGLFLSFLTNPTTGGVSASFASLGDIILAEPDALICFAGPRVIQQTIGQTLPEGFQHAEFLLEHGMLDAIVEREKCRETLYKLLALHQK
ncbi:MAG: acetyl-CoA carboxylase, carboxyltransferase subunit beta [Acetatifactor sp.]|nr:acetyl-CoA carboxylase, carboxyltransferase subunit beta [Acetatifactor sp.]